MAPIGCSSSVIAQKNAVFEEGFNFRNTLTFVGVIRKPPFFLDDILTL
jgi:hypothetical protein